MDNQPIEANTICVGRYLLDIPKELVIRPITANFDGFAIENLGPASESDLNAKINERLKVMRGGGEFIDGKSQVYKFSGKEFRKGTTILYYELEWSIKVPKEWGKYFEIETYFISDGYLFKISEGTVDQEEKTQKFDQIFWLAENTFPRENSDIPAGKVVCIEKAYLTLGQPKSEYVSIGFGAEDSYELNFVFETEVDENVTRKDYDWPKEAVRFNVAGFEGTQALMYYDNGPTDQGFHGEFYGFEPSRSGIPPQALKMTIDKQYAPFEEPYPLAEAVDYWALILKNTREK